MDSATHQTAHSKGIYRGLPTFPSDPGSHSAIVCGANGISGQAMLKVLAANPDHWPDIYSFSRRFYVEGTPDGKGAGVDGEQIRHLQLDFLGGPEYIAKDLVEYAVEGEYVFWFAYKEDKDPRVMDEENGECLRLRLWGSRRGDEG
jgi:hypothetical protein